ncbi:MAG: hypothetical protein QNJ98_07220 [Planctomycetota bacterium]|nr:hypothetical protein [Planctomycetota bacterium]
MRRLALGLALALGLSLCIGSAATADYYDYELDGAPEVGIAYTVGDGVGELTILGGAGLAVEAYDAAGAPIAGTVIFDSVQTVSVPAHGDASVLYVLVGDQWYEVSANSDPDWNFD